uniref:Pluviatolide O-methyltransferase n=1 Tax=Sinopodophyllum hexandrum TaxID=93608 RepID=A0A8K1WEM3_SINHE|nr:pluviatolide O-methyltransferase [Sinopodophyllum hexandrum]
MEMAPTMDLEIRNGNGYGDSGEELLAAQAHIYNHIFNFISSMALKCAVELNIPEILHNHQPKPVTLSELVQALQIPQAKSACLYRLLRILVHSGFFAITKIQSEGDEEGYLPTLSSKLLLKNHPMSMSPCLLGLVNPTMVAPMHFFSDWFKRSDDMTPFEATHGASFWKYFGETPHMAEIFNEAMGCETRLAMSVVLKECKGKLEGISSLVDVGGGTGNVGRAIAEAFPNVKCTVLDLPQVVGNLKGSNNLEFVSGDMFQFIPPADVVFLKWILHDWNDEECIKILKRCKEAIPSKEEGGKLIIIDMVVNDHNKGSYESTETQLFYDLTLMALLTGTERTETEWKKLFVAAGFTSYIISPVLGLKSIIEVFP